MPRNFFNEAICSDASSVEEELNDLGVDPSECWAQVMYDEDTAVYLAEMKNNDDGETILYVQSKSIEEAKRILTMSGVSAKSIEVL